MTTRFAPLRGITLAALLTLGVGPGLMFGDDVRRQTNVHPRDAERAVPVRRHSHAAPPQHRRRRCSLSLAIIFSMATAPGQTS